MKKHLCLLVFAFLSVSIDVQAQPAAHTSPLFNPDPDNQFWDDRFTLGGPNGSISSMVFDAAGDLYVGGYFSTAGQQISRNVARWDGTAWHPAGEGLTFQGVVNGLVFDENGTLYMSGWDLTDLSRGDDIVAAYDGVSWTSLGDGNWYGQALALAIDDAGSIYAGGQVISTDDNRSHRIVKWDGAAWSALGGKLDGIAMALAVDGSGIVYVGGDFASVGGVAINTIATWDGASWAPLGEGIGEGSVSALATDGNGNLYVGGEFEFAGGEQVQNIARWDGTSWSSLGSGFEGGVRALAFDESGHLYAGGGTTNSDRSQIGLVARWDGVSWSAVGFPLEKLVHAVAVDQNGNVFAGGDGLLFGESGSDVVRWNGRAWSALTEGAGAGLNAGTRSVVADASCDIYVAGGFSVAGNIVVNKIARWDDESWLPVGSGNDDFVFDLATDVDGNLYAGGFFESAGGMPANSIVRWDGASWSPLGEGLRQGEYVGRVYGLASDGHGNLYVGGAFDTAGGAPAGNIAQWDGASWSSLGAGVVGASSFSAINALAIDRNGNLYVGGEFETAGGMPARNIAMWNGSVWSEVGGGIYDSSTGRGHVNALAFDDNGVLYAGGHFTVAGTTKVYHIASWDGVTWKKLGIGFNTTVLSLAVDDNGYLYAGGQFDALGPSGSVGNFNHIARWDGAEWSRLGSGVNGEVRDMTMDGRGNLYVVGGISTAGNKVSNGIARWEVMPNESSSCVERPAQKQQAQIFTSYFPNPFREFATLEITVTEPQHLTVGVYDATGKQVSQLFAGSWSAYQVRRLRLDGATLASGTYFVRVDGEFFSQLQAVTFLK